MVVSSLAHLTFVSSAALFRWCSARAAKDNSGKAVSCAELSYFLFCTTVSKRHLLSLTHGLNKMHTRACRAINKHLSLEHKCVSVSVGSKMWSDIPTSYHTALPDSALPGDQVGKNLNIVLEGIHVQVSFSGKSVLELVDSGPRLKLYVSLCVVMMSLY